MTMLRAAESGPRSPAPCRTLAAVVLAVLALGASESFAGSGGPDAAGNIWYDRSEGCLEEIDNFIDHEAEIKHIVLYYVFSIPFILTYIIPVSLLLGTVFAMGVMARRNEFTALIASGVSLVRVATKYRTKRT